MGFGDGKSIERAATPACQADHWLWSDGCGRCCDRGGRRCSNRRLLRLRIFFGDGGRNEARRSAAPMIQLCRQKPVSTVVWRSIGVWRLSEPDRFSGSVAAVKPLKKLAGSWHTLVLFTPWEPHNEPEIGLHKRPLSWSCQSSGTLFRPPGLHSSHLRFDNRFCLRQRWRLTQPIRCDDDR